MTHNLLLNYGLYRKMEVYRPHKATQDEMTKFHSDDYIKFLRSIRPDNMAEYSKLLQRFNVGEDCPVFDGESLKIKLVYITTELRLKFSQG